MKDESEQYECLFKGQDVAPTFIKPVKRLHDDVLALEHLMSDTKPTPKRMRCSKVGHVFYGCGDASGQGFGRVIEKKPQPNQQSLLEFAHGEWSHWVQETSSSNYRQLQKDKWSHNITI